MNRKRLLSNLGLIGVSSAIVIGWILLLFSVILPHISNGINPFTGEYSYTPLGYFIMFCVFTPIWEEAVFRYAPMQIAKRLKDNFNVDLFLPIILIASAIFGANHSLGIISMALQGALGMLLCYIYMRTKYSYWSVVAIHAIRNISVFYILPLIF